MGCQPQEPSRLSCSGTAETSRFPHTEGREVVVGTEMAPE